jgi:hypothetical protein
LFSIHWPDCAVLDCSEGGSLPPRLTCQIPKEARCVGLFHNQSSRSSGDEWATGLWDHISPLMSANTPNSRINRPRRSERILTECVFYDQNGVALRKH